MYLVKKLKMNYINFKMIFIHPLSKVCILIHTFIHLHLHFALRLHFFKQARV